MENCATCMAINKKNACLYCTHGSNYEGKGATGWHRYADELPESGKALWVVGVHKQIFYYPVGYYGNDVWTHWQYATVPAPPVDHIPEVGGKVIEKIENRHWDVGFYNDKLNEIIDAINDMRGSK